MANFEQWAGFKGRKWTHSVDVRDFIQENYTPYEGDEAFLEDNAVSGKAGVYHEIAAAEAVGIFDLADKGGDAFFLGKIFVYGYFPDVHQFIRVDLGFVWRRLHHGDLLLLYICPLIYGSQP